jgi:hypothetical protein
MRTARGGRRERLRTRPGGTEANGTPKAGQSEGISTRPPAALTYPCTAGTDVALNDPRSVDHTRERHPGTAAPATRPTQRIDGRTPQPRNGPAYAARLCREEVSAKS